MHARVHQPDRSIIRYFFVYFVVGSFFIPFLIFVCGLCSSLVYCNVHINQKHIYKCNDILRYSRWYSSFDLQIACLHSNKMEFNAHNTIIFISCNSNSRFFYMLLFLSLHGMLLCCSAIQSFINRTINCTENDWKCFFFQCYIAVMCVCVFFSFDVELASRTMNSIEECIKCNFIFLYV